MSHIYDQDYIGVLKGNGVGSEFILYDNGVNPELVPEGVFDDLLRRVLCRINYKLLYFFARMVISRDSMSLYLPMIERRLKYYIRLLILSQRNLFGLMNM